MTRFSLSNFAMLTYRREEQPPLEPDVIVEIGRPVRRRRDWKSQAVRYPNARGCPNCGAVTYGLSPSCGRCGWWPESARSEKEESGKS